MRLFLYIQYIRLLGNHCDLVLILFDVILFYLLEILAELAAPPVCGPFDNAITVNVWPAKGVWGKWGVGVESTLWRLLLVNLNTNLFLCVEGPSGVKCPSWSMCRFSFWGETCAKHVGTLLYFASAWSECLYNVCESVCVWFAGCAFTWDFKNKMLWQVMKYITLFLE